jgi:lysophospholipase L1-like esterase
MKYALLARNTLASLLLATSILNAQTKETTPSKETPMTSAALFQVNDRVLFEGDSLTDGLRNNYGRMMAWDKSWGHVMDEWLYVHRADLNLECKNLAVGGSSAKTMLARAEADVAFKPTVALLTIGTNDCIMNIPIETFRAQLDEWCGKIKAAGCRTIIHVGGFPPCPNVDDETKGILERCKPYWATAKEVVESHGGRQVDVAPYMLPRVQALDKRWKFHTVYSSGMHYNALGNELISGAVLSALNLMVLPGAFESVPDKAK